MKKILLFVCMIGLALPSAMAQNTSETFGKGDNTIGLGFGIGGVFGYSNYDVQTPVFGAQYDRGIMEFKFGGVLGVGGFMGYKGYTSKVDYGIYDYKVRSSIFIIGARGTLHYDVFKVENLDTYGGAMIALHVVNESSDAPDAFYDQYYDTHSNAAYASLYVGAKYYFAPKVSAFAEVGYGVSWLTMGIAFKF